MKGPMAHGFMKHQCWVKNPYLGMSPLYNIEISSFLFPSHSSYFTFPQKESVVMGNFIFSTETSGQFSLSMNAVVRHFEVSNTYLSMLLSDTLRYPTLIYECCCQTLWGIQHLSINVVVRHWGIQHLSMNAVVRNFEVSNTYLLVLL